VRGIPETPGAERALKNAHRLAWLSIAYILSTITMLFFVMSGSQALKTEMSGEILSLIPPTLFLVGDRISRREPDAQYPFGYERAVSAGYVGSSVALLLVGLYLLFDGGMKLVMREHPTIGGFPLLDKTLAADAQINAADWQSASAAVVGVIGVGFGLWWVDSAAAVLISIEIIRSGWTELRTALGDIMDRRPKSLDEKQEDPITDRITEFLQRQPWVDDVIVRVRERGRELTAEAHVVPKSNQLSVEQVSEAGQLACKIDPQLADVTIAPVSQIPEDVAKARHPADA
jgi:divalent metal cation (Fe/Co/Zn/Cd) transporter